MQSANSRASSSPLPLAIIVLTFNEALNIERTLRLARQLTDKIYVVDSGSTDQTLELAKRYTPHIYEHPFENYSAQRNWAQQMLPIEEQWVFHLDADEQITPELVQELRQLFAVDANLRDVDGFLVARRVHFMGRWIKRGGLYPVYHLRLFRKDKGGCENRLYDQHFYVNGTVRKLQNDIIDTVTTSLDKWTQRHTRWAIAESQQQLNAQGQSEVVANRDGTAIEKRRWAREAVYDRWPLFLRAFMYFVFRYILRLGFLDGREGLIFHVLQGFWYRFYVDALIYEQRQNEDPSSITPKRP